MRWVRYEAPGESVPHFGSLDESGERIREITGDLFGAQQPSGRTFAMKDVKLLAPIVPPTFYAAGVNYPTHFRTAAEKAGKPITYPKQIDIGYRANNALIGQGEAIVVPKDSSGKVQFEGEIVVVIGKKVKHLTEANALDCVFGYTIGNDVSERSWQASDRTFWRGKNADTFKPMGPWIDTDVKLDALTTIIRLNGKEESRFATNSMIFGIAKTLATMTRYLTLYPGDIVWMGTDDPTRDMVPGDVVEVEITGLGVLRNPVVAET
jgi:2-keto-4-pentenoate hydratase/2-oxohepta-3-ene-1,7-dioic acid hydratase in catechol pathway